jgi:hypothetical protein
VLASVWRHQELRIVIRGPIVQSRDEILFPVDGLGEGLVVARALFTQALYAAATMQNRSAACGRWFHRIARLQHTPREVAWVQRLIRAKSSFESRAASRQVGSRGGHLSVLDAQIRPNSRIILLHFHA